jgi:hypothetical protein
MRPAASVSLLRWSHDHHRDLRARLRAEVPPHACRDSNQDRYLMMLSPPIDYRTDTRHSDWLSAGSPETRGGPQNYPALTAPILSRNGRSARSPYARPEDFRQGRSRQTLQGNLLADAAAKSP